MGNEANGRPPATGERNPGTGRGVAEQPVAALRTMRRRFLSAWSQDRSGQSHRGPFCAVPRPDHAFVRAGKRTFWIDQVGLATNPFAQLGGLDDDRCRSSKRFLPITRHTRWRTSRRSRSSRAGHSQWGELAVSRARGGQFVLSATARERGPARLQVAVDPIGAGMRRHRKPTRNHRLDDPAPRAARRRPPRSRMLCGV